MLSPGPRAAFDAINPRLRGYVSWVVWICGTVTPTDVFLRVSFTKVLSNVPGAQLFHRDNVFCSPAFCRLHLVSPVGGKGGPSAQAAVGKLLWWPGWEGNGREGRFPPPASASSQVRHGFVAVHLPCGQGLQQQGARVRYSGPQPRATQPIARPRATKPPDGVSSRHLSSPLHCMAFCVPSWLCVNSGLRLPKPRHTRDSGGIRGQLAALSRLAHF